MGGGGGGGKIFCSAGNMIFACLVAVTHIFGILFCYFSYICTVLRYSTIIALQNTTGIDLPRRIIILLCASQDKHCYL